MSQWIVGQEEWMLFRRKLSQEGRKAARTRNAASRLGSDPVSICGTAIAGTLGLAGAMAAALCAVTPHPALLPYHALALCSGAAGLFGASRGIRSLAKALDAKIDAAQLAEQASEASEQAASVIETAKGSPAALLLIETPDPMACAAADSKPLDRLMAKLGARKIPAIPSATPDDASSSGPLAEDPTPRRPFGVSGRS